MIAEMVGRAIPHQVVSSLPWVARDLVADHYSQGRVFLAGDAAHQNTPSGGFGLNTGMGDVNDLGWKLAALVQGWGGPRLIDSYEAERRPVAARIVKQATDNFMRDRKRPRIRRSRWIRRPAPRRGAKKSPGGRAPHAWLADGRSTLDLFGRGFTLLRFADAPDAGALARPPGGAACRWNCHAR